MPNPEFDTLDNDAIHDDAAEFVRIYRDVQPGELLDKRLWLEVALMLTPEEAQTLYHTAVFVTKVNR